MRIGALVLAMALAGCIATTNPDSTPLEKPVRIEPDPEPAAEASAPVDADPEPIAAKGEYVHAPSGMAFPERVGSFKRVGIHRYDVEGRNVSVGYNLLRGPFAMAATAYVYPAPKVSSFLAGEELLAEWRARQDHMRLQAEVREIVDGNREDSLEETSRGPVTVRSRGGTHQGTHVAWHMVNALGTPGLRGTTHLHLFLGVGDGWIVKFRFTHPRGIEATAAMERLFAALRWPGDAP